ncbi:MAG TPA: hypothetical protein PK329_06665 [Myxococcota bacterium]|nr:hypothetical protein [Myxococcota bacterium]HON25405.1 hypothetical protein [Myxococcota bacterium]HOS61492.1 hypothetical protein [Myxococcota bacterium]HPC91235.1 hypothetical protein [Myxococcota bacterium]HPL25052.1 hypothetical protein [Myxococcota bacterium]
MGFVRFRWSFFPVVVSLVVAITFTACSFSTQLMPLTGEDDASAQLSGPRIEWLEKTGATMAAHRLHAAVRSGEVGAVFDLLGPSSRAIVNAAAGKAGKTAAELLKTGEVQGLSLRGASNPLQLLASDALFSAREASDFNPSARKVKLILRVGEQPEFEAVALFADDSWRIELVEQMPTESSTGG